MKVLNLRMITDWAPTQIEGVTEENRPVYIRFRSGWLSIEVGQPDENIDCMMAGYTVYENEMTAKSGSENSITIDEIDKILETIDLTERLSEFECKENKYK